MTIEQLLDKLENDRAEAERVRKDCYEKSRVLHKEIKDILDCAYDTDDLTQQLNDLRIRLGVVECDERTACYKLGRIIDTIDEINLRLGRV